MDRNTTTRGRGRNRKSNDCLQSLADESTFNFNDNGKNKNGKNGAPATKPKVAAKSATAHTVASTTRSSKRVRQTKSQASPQPKLMSDPHLIQAMEEARYEAFVDPYRGALPFFSVSYSRDGDGSNSDSDSSSSEHHPTPGADGLQPGEGEVGPWKKCADILNDCRSWHFSNGNGEGGKIDVVNVEDEDEDSRKPLANEEESMVVQCGCPTVDKWASDDWDIHNKQINAKNKKGGRRGGKRKGTGGNNDKSVKSGETREDAIMLVDDEKAPYDNAKYCSAMNKCPQLICGERKLDPKRMYPCDYNPHCLASLGGMVDNYRQSVARIKHVIGTHTEQPSPSELTQLLYSDMTRALNASLQNTSTKKGKNDKDGLRRSIKVDREDVHAHVSRFMCEYGGNTAIASYLTEIQSVHQPLVFRTHDPIALVGLNNGNNEKMELSLPSGLRNLGATCYLNSQLQCLAQNLGFVHGLFSWRRPSIHSGSGIDERMSNVLSKMQSILAQMRYGPERVICTEEFATALNLENDEMQDPNEFARLLFDRMSDSFRRSTETTPGTTTEQNGLRDLLPSIFGGTLNYVTMCSECNHSSRRREDFMELSIPIVDRKEEFLGKKKQSGKTKQGNNSIATAMSDVDVQLCVNSCLHPESLDGDNQYECSECNKKCDATRSMVFEKLPPVLNIQLARYVFDRETLSKRKLTTKVLLPKSLAIPSDATIDQNQQVKYILCAVQNHLGNSAHGGHYVADVMDWATGVWYEFNDENVTILKHGPTSSFEPNQILIEHKHRKVRGSADAYNLFYVAQSYLSKQCKSELQDFQFMDSETTTGTGTVSGNRDVLSLVKDQRKERYQLEHEIQTTNRLKARRIRVRQEQIMKKIFMPMSKLTIPTNYEGSKELAIPTDPEGSKAEGTNVWIESDFLRRFFSCQDHMDDIFQSASKSSTILRSPALCEHSRGLHPRVARTGKLLPQVVYNAVENIMQEEYANYVCNGSGSISPPKELVGERNLICSACGSSYFHEARLKFNLFKTLLSLHDDLIPGHSDLDPILFLDPMDVLGLPSICVISRTWATSFRNYVEKKVNELHNVPRKKSSNEANSVHCGGIDYLDLSEVEVAKNGKTSVHNENKSTNLTKTLSSFKGEDPTSKITCQHGYCSLLHNYRSVRLVPANVWQKITKVFPDAHTHCFVSPRKDAIGNCKQCYLEREEDMLFPQKLEDWKNGVTESALRELLEKGRQTNIETILQNQIKAQITLHALRHIDVQRWRESFSVIEKSLKSKKKNDTIKNELRDLLFVSSESSPLSREWKFRELTCKEHGMTVGLPYISDKKDIKGWLGKLNESSVELLHEEEYQGLIGSLSALEQILCESGSAPLKVSAPLKLSQVPVISIQLQKGMPTIHVNPKVCPTGCSITSFSGECIENGTVVSKIQKLQRTKPAKEKEPTVEEPKGPLCKIIVHEVKNGMDIGVSASQIVLGLSAPSLSSNGRPRRSNKAKGGGGGDFPTYEVEMAFDGNLAHFKLLLHQSKSKKLFGQRLYLIHISPSVFQEQFEELPASSNLNTMFDIITESHSGSEMSNPELLKGYTIRLILSYKSDDVSKSDGTRKPPRKRSRQEEKELEQNLLAALLDVACGGGNTADTRVPITIGNKSKRRRQERGFQGTFLQSSDFSDSQPLVQSTSKVRETIPNAHSEELIVFDSPRDNGVVASVNIDDDRSSDIPQILQDEKTNALVVDSPEADKDSASTKSNDDSKCDKDDASAKENDDCKELEQRVKEEFDRAYQGSLDCTQGSDLHSLKEQTISVMRSNPGELPRSATRQISLKHINGVASAQCNDDKQIAAEEQSSAHEDEREKATANCAELLREMQNQKCLLDQKSKDAKESENQLAQVQQERNQLQSDNQELQITCKQLKSELRHTTETISKLKMRWEQHKQRMSEDFDRLD